MQLSNCCTATVLVGDATENGLSKDLLRLLMYRIWRTFTSLVALA